MSRQGYPGLGLAVALIALAGCASAPAPPRVVLVGVDGLERSVLAEMFAAGELPHLRALAERGVHGELETIEPTLSPVVWTTIATGKLPAAHGIEHFVRAEAGGKLRLLTSADRKVRAFWNILSERGKRVHVIGWFLTYPAEPIRGVMVSQFTTLERAREFWKGGLEKGVPHQTYPEAFLAEVEEDLDAVARELPELERRLFGSPEGDLQSLERKLVEHTRWALEADALYGRIAERLLRSDPEADVLAVYFGGPDVVGHRFWRYYRPEGYRFPPAEAARQRFAQVIPNYYRLVDAWIGRLVEAAGTHTHVIVLSDHGMYAANREVPFDRLEGIELVLSGHHLDVASAPAVFLAAGPRIARDGAALDTWRRLGRVTDVLPTLLALLELPVAEDMAGGVLASVLAPAFVAGHPVSWVASYETPRPREAAALDPQAEREMLERFRALGYIGGD